MTAAKLEITTPSERELRWARSFNAPRELVFEAMTDPALLRRWLLGPPGWEMEVCEVDLRVGGKYRYAWRRDSGKRMGMAGVFREIVAPARIVSSEVFEESWYSGEAASTVELTERGGVTTMVQTMQYESRKARDEVLRSGFEDGVSVSYDRLAGVLAERSSAA